MTGGRSRRWFLRRDLPALGFGLAAAGCGLMASVAAEQLAKRYLALWTRALGSMRSPYHGGFDRQVVAVAEFRAGGHGGEFLPLIQVIEAAKPDVVALEGLRHDSDVVRGWNRGDLFPYVMFNYYLRETEGRTLRVAAVRPPGRDASLEELFRYLREKRIRLAGIEPSEVDVADALLAATGRLTEEQQKSARAALLVENADRLRRSGQRIVTFTEFLRVRRVAPFLTPLLATAGDWRRLDPDALRENPRALFASAEERVGFYFDEPETYTVDGAFGDGVQAVLGMEPAAVQRLTEDMALRLRSMLRAGAISDELSELRAALLSLREAPVPLGYSPEDCLVTSLAGGLREGPLLF